MLLEGLTNFIVVGGAVTKALPAVSAAATLSKMAHQKTQAGALRGGAQKK